MRRPNVYKGIIGVMDLTYKELSSEMSRGGFDPGDISEICRAVRGYSGPKYDRIRRCLLASFCEWLAELESSGAADELKPYVKIGNVMKLDAAFPTIGKSGRRIS